MTTHFIDFVNRHLKKSGGVRLVPLTQTSSLSEYVIYSINIVLIHSHGCIQHELRHLKQSTIEVKK
jgi:hypothetical protein